MTNNDKEDGEYNETASTSIGIERRELFKSALLSSMAVGGLSVLTDRTLGQTTSQDDWPQFQFDIGNTGYDPNGSGPTEEVGIQWNPFTTAGRVSSPVVANGTIYFGSADNNVYAVDASDGSLAWPMPFETDGTVRTPAVSDGTVYVGGGGKVYALNAADGTKQWSWPFPQGTIADAPAVVNDTVYVPGGDDRFFALDANDGSKQWQVFTDECFGGNVSAPAVTNGTVYFTEDCGRAWAVDALSGNVEWKFADDSGPGEGSPPAVANGTVYFGTVTAGSPAGNSVYALDASDGSELWQFSFQPEGDIRSSPAVANGRVIFGSANGNVYALDVADGAAIWDEPFSTGGEVSSSPAVVDETVYIGSADGKLYAIDVESGNERFQFDLGSEIQSDPAVTNGAVNVGSEGGSLYRLRGNVDENPPSAAFSFSPEEPVTTEEVIFDASESTDTGGAIASFEWDFDGDGAFEASGERVTTRFTEPGDQTVTLRVTDTAGNTATASKSLTVTLRGRDEKLDLADDVDMFSLTPLNDRPRAEATLDQLATDVQNNETDIQVAEETVTRLLLGEQVTSKALENYGSEANTGDSDELPRKLAKPIILTAIEVYLGARGAASGSSLSAIGGASDALQTVGTNLLSAFFGTASDAESDAKRSITNQVTQLAKGIRTGSITNPSDLGAAISEAADLILDGVAASIRTYLEQIISRGITDFVFDGEVPGLSIADSIDYLLDSLDATAARQGLSGSTQDANLAANGRIGRIEREVKTTQGFISDAERIRDQVEGVRDALLSLFKQNPGAAIDAFLAAAAGLAEILLSLAQSIITAAIVGVGLQALFEINRQHSIGIALVVSGEVKS